MHTCVQEEGLSLALRQKTADVEALETAQRAAEENHVGAVVSDPPPWCRVCK